MAEGRGDVTPAAPGSRRVSKLPNRAFSVVPKHSLMSAPATAATSGAAGASASNRVLINVGGIRYETYRSTLKNIPDTRLAWLTESSAEAAADFDPATGEYFFDRHPGLFNMILNYYRTGKLHVPTDVCGPLFEEELAFWGIEEDQIEPCCWTTYRSHRDAQETLKELNIENVESDDEDGEEEDRYIAQRFGIEETSAPKERVSRWKKWRPKIWVFLIDPKSSKGAKCLSLISIMFVILSITTFCLESHVSFRVPYNASDPISEKWTTLEKNTKSRPVLAMIILDYITLAFFTIEFTTHLICSPNKRIFFCGLKNWIEILAIVPMYIETMIILIVPSLEYNIYLQILKSLRLIRIFRILKLTRHFSGLQVLWKAIKASAKELLLLILFLFISVLIFACLMYYAEAVQEAPINDFKNIPLGFWWAVVTMTTLGYGDMYPRTALGYLVGVICSIAGVLVLALPVPVIVNNFSLYYSHAQAQIKLPKKRKRVLVGARDELKTDYPFDVEPSEDNNNDCEGGVEGGERRDSGQQSVSDSPEVSHSEPGDGDSECTGVSVPGRRQPKRGISVVFTDEMINSPHITSKRASRRKVFPAIVRRLTPRTYNLGEIRTSSPDQSPSEDGSPTGPKTPKVNRSPVNRDESGGSGDAASDTIHQNTEVGRAEIAKPRAEIDQTSDKYPHKNHKPIGMTTISNGDVYSGFSTPLSPIPMSPRLTNGHVTCNGHMTSLDCESGIFDTDQALSS